MKCKLTNKFLIPVTIAFVFMACMLLWIWTSFRADGKVVVIRKGNKVVEEIDLSIVQTPYTIDLDTNVIYIEKDGVSMKLAKCPDKVCVHMGKIDKKGESIVCAPNKVMIEFKDKDFSVDAVAGGR